MRCSQCGAELPHGANSCTNCGAPVDATTKVGDTAQRTSEVAVDVGKKVGKGALKLGGKALAGAGSLAKKAGKKLEDAGKDQ